MQVYVETPGLNDVLCGRGGATNQHEGNVRYRALVQSRQHEYLHAAKSDKKQVALSIVKIIKSRGGRFLKKCEDGRVGWVDIGSNRAREKTSQALREGLDVLKKDTVAAVTAAAAETVAKRKAEDDAAGDGSKKKKAVANTSPTAAPVVEDATAATDDIAAAAEAAMLAAPINNTNRTPPPPPTGTFADATKAAFTATAGDYANAASTPGVATDEINAATAAPELVAEKAPAYNVPVPAPALSYFDYAASFALSTSASAGAGAGAGASSSADASAGSFNYPGTSNLGGYGYPYPFPGYPPVGSSYGHYGLGYDTNLYASAAASFGIPPPPVDHCDEDDEDDEEEAFVVGETAQI